MAGREDRGTRCGVATVKWDAGRRAGAALAARLGRMCDLHADAAGVGGQLARDAWLGPLVDAAPGLRGP
ncbi:AlkA N-terminal domain-containing protein, partial [Burkholderia thailandensis]|uniref:AlkA N-terminal domain-containing protein n=1 Tax=Burkholderia thailandensis TaxID=57975 RepID=UPI0034D97AE0